MKQSHLFTALTEISSASSAAIAGRAKISSKYLNGVIRNQFRCDTPSSPRLIAEPVYELAKIWETAPETLGDLSGHLLDSRLIQSLDKSKTQRMPKNRHPYLHQRRAWEAAKAGNSVIVTSGTGSGKTECFMIPILDDLLRAEQQGKLVGVRAIIIYPLNALIESQRERLDAWTESLSDRITYALYNGLTPERLKKSMSAGGAAELPDRESIRSSPPSILITNVTMLEYLLLRAQDQSILSQSQGLLKWIVLDEAHTYIGSQAAEMTLLLRRVRSAFGVSSDQVQLIATSATISEGGSSATKEKLQTYISALAGLKTDKVSVIEGKEKFLELPPADNDSPIVPAELLKLNEEELWDKLAKHPRIQKLHGLLSRSSQSLSQISKLLFDTPDKPQDAQIVLDAIGQAKKQELLLLPWRAHIFHRAVGGLWTCLNSSCKEKNDTSNDWYFGSANLFQNNICACGAPTYEIVTCSECGSPYVAANLLSGKEEKIISTVQSDFDDYQLDLEPGDSEDESDTEAEQIVKEQVWVRPPKGNPNDRVIDPISGKVFDDINSNKPGSIRVSFARNKSDRDCCARASRSTLQKLRYGPPFFIGSLANQLLENFTDPEEDTIGHPMGGRRAISFTDSRQGVARLSAKLQQDAERFLTRSFLTHFVYEAERAQLNPDKKAELEAKIAKYKSIPDLADEVASWRKELDPPQYVTWPDLVSNLAAHADMEHALKIWRQRDSSGHTLGNDKRKLAEMFLYRELFRRPRIQNSVETLGFIKLIFPKLDEISKSYRSPILVKRGINEIWPDLLQVAIDFVFRDNFAVDIKDDDFARWINPRNPGRRSVYASSTLKANAKDKEKNAIFWPSVKDDSKRPHRLVKLLLVLLSGGSDKYTDCVSEAQHLLDEMWKQITSISKIAIDSGGGAYRLDFSQAAVTRLKSGWVCPVTRRMIPYNINNRTPFDPNTHITEEPIILPCLPDANKGGITVQQRNAIKSWLSRDQVISKLRDKMLWSDLSDKICLYQSYYRSQEHSAQIERAVLQSYEDEFRAGDINLLNCSTTMEMGVDIPNVKLTLNTNVPPALSNYRQRVGRAGRRGEPWAFAVTFCRDLPLDKLTFSNPQHYLSHPIPAPLVRLDSKSVIQRHINAALLALYFRSRDGMNIQASAVSFFGSTAERRADISKTFPASEFINSLKDSNFIMTAEKIIEQLIIGTSLSSEPIDNILLDVSKQAESLAKKWYQEIDSLHERIEILADFPEVKASLTKRAERMEGEFLLSELAKRGFTPAYGFPVDVVNFEYNSPRSRQEKTPAPGSAYTPQGAARTLDVAIREYAPGAEVIIDGLVHLSEGLLPAWSTNQSDSHLEDLRTLWRCDRCGNFELNRGDKPESCPECQAVPSGTQCVSTIKPSGFIGTKTPHTGYESLQILPYELPIISLPSKWQSFPTRKVARFRTSSDGQVVTLNSGMNAKGYALCLCCGRAQSETDDLNSGEILKNHYPLAPIPKTRLVNGYCPGGTTERHNIKRNIRLVADTRTDVFELRRLDGSRGNFTPILLALAASLREALADILGIETREIGVSASTNSLYLFDRAAGGAGFVSRLSEKLGECLELVTSKYLNCPDKCKQGCPSCFLRPDLNFSKVLPDREGALAFSKELRSQLEIPKEHQIFGDQSIYIDQDLTSWLEKKRLSNRLQSVSLFIHGNPELWDAQSWPALELLHRLSRDGIETRILYASKSIANSNFKLIDKLALIATSAKTGECDKDNSSKGTLLAELVSDNKIYAVRTLSTDCSALDARWGGDANDVLVAGTIDKTTSYKEVSEPDFIKLDDAASAFWIKDELNGPASDFGIKFWNYFENKAPSIYADIESAGISVIKYSDRYLLTPLHYRLLYSVIKNAPSLQSNPKILINVAETDPPLKLSSYIHQNFPKTGDRINVLKALLPEASIVQTSRDKLSHARVLEITLNSGRSVEVLLDQGMGPWRSNSGYPHPFNSNQQAQAQSIVKSNPLVFMGERRGSPIVYVKKF